MFKRPKLHQASIVATSRTGKVGLRGLVDLPLARNLYHDPRHYEHCFITNSLTEPNLSVNVNFFSQELLDHSLVDST